MTVATDPVLSEIEELQAQVRDLNDRIANLRKLRTSPAVIPVLVYWRYQRKHEEPLDLWDWDEHTPLQAAYESLEMQSDMGECSPEGVEVNGVFIDFADLREMFDPSEKTPPKPTRNYVVETTMQPERFEVVPEWEYRHLDSLKIVSRAWELPSGD